jgi:hypothetical protein
MYGYLYMQLRPPQIVNQPHVLLLLHRYNIDHNYVAAMRDHGARWWLDITVAAQQVWKPMVAFVNLRLSLSNLKWCVPAQAPIARCPGAKL